MSATEERPEWDRVAESYAVNCSPFTSMHGSDMLTCIKSKLRSPSTRTILDVGCGSGSLALAFLRLFPEGFEGQTFICTDISPRMVNAAKTAVTNNMLPRCKTRFDFRVEDGTSLASFADASVDVLLSLFGVFLIPQRDDVFKAVRRVLVRGGMFATSAWIDPPIDFSTAPSTFGFPFEETFGRVYKILGMSEDDEDSPDGDKEESTDDEKKDSPDGKNKEEESDKAPHRFWEDDNSLKRFLKDCKFDDVSVQKAMHSAAFENVQQVWDLATNAVPVMDVSIINADKLAKAREAFAKELKLGDPSVANKAVFLVTASNLVTARWP